MGTVCADLPTNASMEAASGSIMAQGRPHASLSEPEQCLPASKIVIEFSKRPAVVVGTNSYGTCRVES